jgi:hypothetical protein
MHYRRIVCLVLGMWIGGGFMMAWFGTRSFQSVERLMHDSNPALALQTRPMGTDVTRQVLRYHVADQNRVLFQNWEYFQLLMGGLFFAYLLFGTIEGKFSLALALGMFLLTAVQRFGISNELGALGKSLDYIPFDIAKAERAKFWLMHGAYVGVEVLKYGAAAVLLALALKRGRSVDAVNKFDMIDKSNHRHVNW